jgi:CheY-like chemotaxis protein
MARVLSVSYDKPLMHSRQMLREHEGYTVVSSLGFTASIAHCRRGGFDLFILAHSIPDPDKQELVDRFRKHCPAPIIVLCRHAFEEAVRGADHNLEPDPKPCSSLSLKFFKTVVPPAKLPKRFPATSGMIRAFVAGHRDTVLSLILQH